MPCEWDMESLFTTPLLLDVEKLFNWKRPSEAGFVVAHSKNETTNLWEMWWTILKMTRALKKGYFLSNRVTVSYMWNFRSEVLNFCRCVVSVLWTLDYILCWHTKMSENLKDCGMWEANCWRRDFHRFIGSWALNHPLFFGRIHVGPQSLVCFGGGSEYFRPPSLPNRE